MEEGVGWGGGGGIALRVCVCTLCGRMSVVELCDDQLGASQLKESKDAAAKGCPGFLFASRFLIASNHKLCCSER